MRSAAPGTLAGWTLLGSLLAATLAGAAFYDRTGWPGHLAGEATYLMQARSLADDFDLTYTRADFDRMLLADRGNPTDLALTSGSRGRRIAFDRPFPYAVYLAPFLKLWPRHGFAVANALLLTLVCVFAARTLERRLGPWGAPAVALLAFGSVVFAYVFLATGDLFLFAVTLAAFCLLVQGKPEEPGAGTGIAWRSAAAGALLAIPAATEPPYAVLGLAAFFALRGADRRVGRPALAAGFLAGVAVLAVAGWWAGGGLFGLGASSFRFTPQTGYPLVDFTAAEWPQTVRRLGALYFDGAPRFSWGLDPLLWLWNGLYLVAGRSIGLVPYFAPLLLIAAGASSATRRPLLLGAAAWALGIVVLQPFNVYGGEGAVANRLFLPVYGALWVLAEAGHRRRAALATASAAVLAALFLWPLWTSPWSYPIDGERGYRHVTSLARRVLPFESSQRPMPGSGVTEHHGLMVKLLSDHAWVETGRGRLKIEGGEPVEMLIASILDLDVLRFDFGPEAPGGITFSGGRVAERILEPGGGISFRVLPRGLPRRHATWWTPRRQRLYLLALELPAAPEKALAFEIHGERFEAP